MPPGIVASEAEKRELPVWRLLLARPAFLIGAAILVFWIVCAFFGTAIAPHDPLAQQLLAVNAPPSAAHWFGTDLLGRDVFSRVIAGAQAILIIAPLATLLGAVLGTALGSSTRTQILIIGFIFAPLIARTVRSAVQVEGQLDYVPAARLLGERPGRLMFAEILPNVFPTVLVEFTVRLGYAIFTVVTLAFLGFGGQPSTPNWGTDIYANYVLLGAGYWWETLFPALAIASLIIAINLVGDSIEQVLAG